MVVDLELRRKLRDDQKLQSLFKQMQDSVQSSLANDKSVGQDEDFLKIMKYIAKRLDFQILLQLQMIKLLKTKK